MKLRDNEHIRNFLRGSTRLDSNPLVLDWQDPTFIGFEIKFEFNELSSILYQDVESIGNPLLMSSKEPAGAIQYLQNINEPARAKMLASFRNMLHTISTNAPWHFQSISGLDSLFKIDPTKNTRVLDDAIITLECLEGIDMKITAMIDAYRKASWDSIGHRWMLPENMKNFKCYIKIIDYREFHRTKFLETKAGKMGDPEMNNSFEDSVHDKIFGDGDGESITNGASQKMKNLISNLTNTVLSDNETTADDSFIPSIILECDLCEFDFMNYSPPFVQSSISMGDVGDSQATQTIKFKVGRVREVSRYDLVGIWLSDHGIRENWFPGSAGDTTDENTAKALDILQRKLIKKAEGLLQSVFLGNAYGLSISNLEGTAYNVGRAAMRAIDNQIHGRNKIQDNANLTTPTGNTEISPSTIDMNFTNSSLYNNPNVISNYKNKYEVVHSQKRQSLQSNINFINNVNKQYINNDIDLTGITKNETLNENIEFNKTNTKNVTLDSLDFDTQIHTGTLDDNINFNNTTVNKSQLSKIEFSGPPSV